MTAEKDEVIVLTDEEGDEHEFAVIDVIEVEGRDYAILLPYSSEEEDFEEEEAEEAEGEEEEDDLGLEDEVGGDEAIILRIDKDDEGDDILVDIEDEEEWQRVADAWDELLDEELAEEEEEEDDEEDEEEDDDKQDEE